MTTLERYEWDPELSPPADVWAQRLSEYQLLLNETQGTVVFSAHEQTFALEQDMRRSFLVGAWVATIILAHALIEVDLSDRQLLRREEALTLLGTGELYDEVQWLRQRRRGLAHLNPREPGTELAFTRDVYQTISRDARRAVRAALYVLSLGRR